MLRDTINKYINFYQLCMSVPDYNYQDIDETNENDATSGKTSDSSSILVSSSSNNNNSNINGNITDDEDLSINSLNINSNNYNDNNMKSNSTSSSLLKQNIDNNNNNNNDHNHNDINYDERDPLTLEPYSDIVFIFRPQNTTLEIKYNAESLICYYLSSHKLVDPVTSLPLSESDLEELDRLKTILIEQSQVNNNNCSSNMEVERESMNSSTSTSTTNIPIPSYNNNNIISSNNDSNNNIINNNINGNNVNNIDVENSSNGSSYGSNMVIGSAMSFKSYFEQEELKSNKAIEKEKNYQILNLETMLGEIASSLLEVIETNRVTENNEIEVSMYCSQYDCLFQQLKEIDLEKAYQMLKSSEAFLKGPKKKPTIINALFQSVRQFLLTLWTENDEKSLELYRDEAAVRSRSGSIDSSYSGSYAFGTSPGSFGSSLATSLTTNPSITTTTTTTTTTTATATTNTITNTITSSSHRLDINERSDSQDSSISGVSMLSSSVSSLDSSPGGVAVFSNNDNNGDNNGNSNGNNELSSSLHVIFENIDDIDDDNTIVNDTTTINASASTSTTNNDIPSIVQGTMLLLLPPSSSTNTPPHHTTRPPLPPPPSTTTSNSCNVIIAYNNDNEEQSGSYADNYDEEVEEEEVEVGVRGMDSDDEEEAFFGAFSV